MGRIDSGVMVWFSGLILTATVLGVVLVLRRKRRLARTVCGRCGYSREGGFDLCSECGTAETAQADLWKRKYWRRCLAMLAVGFTLAYLVSRARDIYRSGVMGVVPNFALVYSEVAYRRDVAHERNVFMSPAGWWSYELSARGMRGTVPHWQMRWASEQYMRMIDRPGVNGDLWFMTCIARLDAALDRGVITAERYFDVVSGHMIETRERWPEGTEMKARVRFLEALCGYSYRRMELRVIGETTVQREFKRLTTTHTGGLYRDVMVDLPEPRDGAMVFEYVVYEDFGEGERVIYEGRQVRSVRRVDSWEKTRVEASRDVLRSGDWWWRSCAINVYGEDLGNGKWVFLGVAHDHFWRREYEDLGVGVRIKLVVNGEEQFEVASVVRTNMYEQQYEAILPWARDDPAKPLGVLVDFGAGDTCELVITSDRGLALQNMSATSYWDGEVVVPITIPVQTHRVPMGGLWYDTGLR